MSIEKLKVSQQLEVNQEKRQFTTLLNTPIQKIKNSDALAVWVYLSSMPPNWIINKQHIMNHYNWGRDRTNNAFKYLEKNGLLEKEQDKNEDGTFGNIKIEIKCGYDFINDTVSKKSACSTVDGLTVNGETAAIYKINNTNKNNNKNINIYRSSDDEQTLRKEFEQLFWPFYPRKQGKEQAFRSWKKIKQEDKALIFEDLINRAVEWSGKDKKHIAMAGTYLNNARWTDEIIVDKPRSSGDAFSQWANQTSGNVYEAEKLNDLFSR